MTDLELMDYESIEELNGHRAKVEREKFLNRISRHPYHYEGLILITRYCDDRYNMVKDGHGKLIRIDRWNYSIYFKRK